MMKKHVKLGGKKKKKNKGGKKKKEIISLCCLLYKLRGEKRNISDKRVKKALAEQGPVWHGSPKLPQIRMPSRRKVTKFLPSF